MAQQGYLFIKGAVQEEIETSLDKDGIEGGIPFFKFRHPIRVPEIEGFAQREGLPAHGAIEVVKEVDEVSTKLLRALCTAEWLDEVELRWYMDSGNNNSELFYAITMTGCRLVGITTEKPDVRDQKNEQLRLSEIVEITYRTISWEYGQGDSELIFNFDTAAPLGIDDSDPSDSASVSVDA